MPKSNKDFRFAYKHLVAYMLIQAFTFYTNKWNISIQIKCALWYKNDKYSAMIL